MSIANEITRINTNIAAAYTACDKRGADMPQAQNSANLASTIRSIRSKGVKPKDVNFYDYDGTRLYAFTKAEALALESLPAAPVHEGLTSQGWNQTLSGLKAYVTKYGIGDAGAVYASDDGTTRLKLRADDASLLSLDFYCKIKNGTLTAKVNGQTIATETESSDSEVSHVISLTLPAAQGYPADYEIRLSFEGSGYYAIGGGSVITRIFGWDSLKNNTLREAVIGTGCRISNVAFGGCDFLEKVIIPGGVTSIGNFAFQYCSSLKSIVLPDGMTGIGSGAFQYCGSLDRIILSDTVTSIGDNAFRYCGALAGIVIPEQMTSIGTGAFQLCTSLTEVVIPDGVTSISDSVFQYCGSLSGVVLSDTVIGIGSGAFQYCGSLDRIMLSDTVTSLGNNAFRYCSYLNRLTIPASVASIGSGAFQYCSSLMLLDLSEFTDPNALPALSNANVFSDTPSNMVIYVASQTMLTAFASATNWSTYASRFQIKGANT